MMKGGGLDPRNGGRAEKKGLSQEGATETHDGVIQLSL